MKKLLFSIIAFLAFIVYSEAYTPPPCGLSGAGTPSSGTQAFCGSLLNAQSYTYTSTCSNSLNWVVNGNTTITANSNFPVPIYMGSTLIGHVTGTSSSGSSSNPSGTITIKWYCLDGCEPGEKAIRTELAHNGFDFARDPVTVHCPEEIIGSICGQKFFDQNANGIKDSGEPGLANWTIQLNGPGGAQTVNTNASGNYCFYNLHPGTYTINEVNQAGWTQTFPASPGTHTINLGLNDNIGNIDFGNFSKPGRICGRKFNDLNQNGVLDLSEQQAGMSGWTIQLKDVNGNVIATDVTITGGSYCFDDLEPGDYTVCEVNQFGWAQSFPAAPGVHNITLGVSQQLYGINFGNHKVETGPCTVTGDLMVTNQDGCLLEVSSILAITQGTQVLSVLWDFGDGTTAHGYSASHHYNGGGSYEVCMRVTAIKDGECCILEVCEKVTIRCPEQPCEIDGDFSFIKNDCTYDFSGLINFATRDVDVWYWDFGDGTTATGQNATHTFTPGSYTVCLTMISKSEEKCCMDRICKNIYIDKCGGDPKE